jgi:cytochrome c
VNAVWHKCDLDLKGIVAKQLDDASASHGGKFSTGAIYRQNCSNGDTRDFKNSREALVGQVLWVAAIASLFGCGTEACAQERGSAAAGRQLAQRWCSECHQMDDKPGRVESHPESLSFLEIANEPAITPLSLRVFFRSSHENMPNVHISPSQADDLSAYILSLKRR